MRFGLVRRGFSNTGGAEAFMRRFAEALVAAKHEVSLFATGDWPAEEWRFGSIVRVAGGSARGFADCLQRMQPRKSCDFLFSFERIWECDCYRAGDGVHCAWLERRAQFEPRWRSWLRRWSRKHRDILELEERLFRGGGRRVIANSQMVRDEIIKHYDCPAANIHVVYNGIPKTNSADRLAARDFFGLRDDDTVILFAGSGWERKGLQFAIDAVGRVANATLLVAGRGKARRYSGAAETRFLGPVREMQNCFAAADLFLLPTIYDPFSNACLEAAAAGIPVITTRSNGFSEVMTPGVHGEVVDNASEVAAIAEAIHKWSNANRRAAASADLKQLAAEYDLARNVNETLLVIGS